MRTVDVTAPSAGSIIEILVVVGDTVASGAEVLVMESMKMEIPAEAPAAGAVSEILVAVGDPVDEGTVLARIEVG